MSAAQSVPSMLEQALAFVRAGWAVFPLQPRGKQPIGTLVPHGVKDASKDESMVRRLWGVEPNANIGLACGDGIVVIDIDGPEGRASLDLLEAQHGVLPLTFAVRTGRDGGLHLYFRVPRGMDVSNRSLAEGLDVRADGAYVVSHGSVHANGRTYDAVDHTQPMAELPAWLCDRVRRKVAPKLRVVPTPDRGELDGYQAKAFASAMDRLKAVGPTTNNRHNTYRDEVHGLAKCGAPREVVEGPLKVLALASGLDARDVEVTFADAWAAGTAVRTENPAERTRREFCADVEAGMRVGEARRKHQVSTAQSNAWLGSDGVEKPQKKPQPIETTPVVGSDQDGPDTPSNGDSAADHPVPQGQGTGEVDAWIRQSGLRMTEAGAVAKTTANCAIILRGCPGLAGLMRWNEFAQRAEFSRPPPWERRARALVADDEDAADCMIWIQGTIRGASYEPATVGGQMEMAARGAPFDPLREYLTALVWDGVPRLDLVLADLFGVEEGDWARTASRRWFVSAVARALNPGVKADCVLVIEGEQGAQKSSALRALASGVDGAFLDESINVQDKDSKAQCAGTWIWELQEGQVFTRHSADALKSFFSKSDDTYRPPYARKAIRMLRRTVFAITVNDDGGGYLTDTTGARRYWPVTAHRIDLHAIQEARDQIWAEAVQAQKGGAQHWLTDDEKHLARAATDLREVEHPWNATLSETIRGRSSTGVTVGELLRAVGMELQRSDGAHAQRIAAFLKRRGWSRKQVGRNRVCTWYGPDELPGTQL